jgi:hypothetical protein
VKTSKSAAPDGVAANFGSFLALPLALPGRSQRVSPSEIPNLCASIADSIGAALKSNNIAISPIELYLPSQLSGTFFRIFNTAPLIQQFKQLAETRLFGASTALSSSSAPLSRLHLHERALNYNPPFDQVLGERLLVRSLSDTSVPVPSSPMTAPQSQGGQLLLGFIQVKDSRDKVQTKQPIWSWRSPNRENRIYLNLDFDLLSKALPQQFHRFPLGCELMCKVSEDLANYRLLDEVSFDISEMKKWKEYLDGMGGAPASKVTWVALLGDDKVSSDLHLHPDIIPVQPESKVLDSFALGGGKSVPVDRVFGISVRTATETWTYLFAFFQKIPSYSPDKNVLRIWGQMLPDTTVSVVALPAGDNDYPQPVFRLTPVSGTDRFTMLIEPGIEYDVQVGGTVWPAGQPVDLQVGGSKVELVPRATNAQANGFTFDLLPPTLIPDEVLNSATQRGRPYKALLQVTGPEERGIKLIGKEYVLKKKRHFPADAFGIGDEVLKVLKPYVYLDVRPGASQEAWIVDKDKPKANGRDLAVLLGQGGKELELNGRYEIYVGDYQITLNLNSTSPL